MNFKILNIKPKIKTESGVEYIDLSPNSLSTFNIYNEIIGYDIVDEFTEMRIDKIAEKWGISLEDLPILMKVNNIFNPYNIKKGMVLLIPNIKEGIYKNHNEIKNDVRAKYNTKIIKDLKISSFEDSLKYTSEKRKRLLKTPLPPSMLQQGQVSKTINGNVVNITNNE